jgi:hypothetical protein
MSQVLSATHDMYRWVMSKADPRSQNYPLMQSPLPILSIIATYIYFVKVFGPNYMKNRPAYRIEGLIIAYNVLMVILSTYFFVDGGRMTYFSGYNFFCEPVNYSPTGEPARLVSVSWWFMMLKLAELLDTVSVFSIDHRITRIAAWSLSCFVQTTLQSAFLNRQQSSPFDLMSSLDGNSDDLMARLRTREGSRLLKVTLTCPKFFCFGVTASRYEQTTRVARAVDTRRGRILSL